MKTGRVKLLCSSCGQVYRILSTDNPGESDATVYGECDGCQVNIGLSCPQSKGGEVFSVLATTGDGAGYSAPPFASPTTPDAIEGAVVVSETPVSRQSSSTTDAPARFPSAGGASKKEKA